MYHPLPLKIYVKIFKSQTFFCRPDLSTVVRSSSLFLQSIKNSWVYTLFNFPGAWEHRSTLPNLVPLPQRNNFQPGGLCLRVVVSFLFIFIQIFLYLFRFSIFTQLVLILCQWPPLAIIASNIIDHLIMQPDSFQTPQSYSVGGGAWLNQWNFQY